VLNVRSVSIRILGSASQCQRGQQPFGIDGVSESLKQFEGSQPTLQELQPMSVRSKNSQDGRVLLGHRAQQIEP
jgi:hypothetical protein